MEKKPSVAYTPKICTIEAPCKINLHLAIGGKRPDGFHSLESIFASVALADTLYFESAGKEWDSVLSVNWEIPQREYRENLIPPENNLILRAISLFRDRTGFNSALKIRLTKRIPIGSGLGGGSSDAASTLLALNSLAGGALNTEELKAMAAQLGSDVPFFLTGGGAFVSGRGELIKPVKLPEGLWVVLSKPPFPSDTVLAYRLLDEARERAGHQSPVSGDHSGKALIRALKEAPEAWPFRNDFLPVLLEGAEGEQGAKSGAYRALLDTFQNKGACFSGLTGSGSCCFGIFQDRAQAEKAEKALCGKGNFTRLTFFLAHSAKPVLK